MLTILQWLFFGYAGLLFVLSLFVFSAAFYITKNMAVSLKSHLLCRRFDISIIFSWNRKHSCSFRDRLKIQYPVAMGQTALANTGQYDERWRRLR